MEIRFNNKFVFVKFFKNNNFIGLCLGGRRVLNNLFLLFGFIKIFFL